jgi:3'-phosphoadenosine 5'-phosphosulfate sulfotransferase (PAPS reductase)/FAD synthetase
VNQQVGDELQWLAGRPLFASMSGGKDSTALGLWLRKQGLTFTPVFIDTGWEHPATYEYIEKVLVPVFGEFTVLRNEKYFQESSEWKGGMEQLVRAQRMFPSGLTRFCTRLLKVVPSQNFMSGVLCSTGVKPVSAVGIRADESASRSKMGEVEEQDEATVWRPLINWTEADVRAIHAEFGLRPNPLYLQGASRVGCWPCIHARKHELRHLAAVHPERIAHIGALEERVTALRQAHNPELGAATFFKSRVEGVARQSIGEVVAWAQQKDGVALDDIEEIEEAGCMRWGLCEKAAPPDEGLDAP